MSSPVVPKRREFGLERFELIVHHDIGVVQKTPDQRRFAVIDRAAGQEPQEAAIARAIGNAGSDRRALKIPLLFLALHRGDVIGIDQPPLPLRGARPAQFGHDIGDRRAADSTAPVSG